MKKMLTLLMQRYDDGDTEVVGVFAHRRDAIRHLASYLAETEEPDKPTVEDIAEICWGIDSTDYSASDMATWGKSTFWLEQHRLRGGDE